jgi:thioesterase domain-containing protein
VEQSSGKTNAAELREFLKEKLPDYMIPSAFVFLDSLPLTAAGKIDRKALPHPDPSARAAHDVYVPAATPTERLLAPIWAEMLGIERIGIHDNFFELGGHSLLVVRLCARIKKLSGKDIPLAELFRAPTIAQLARFYDGGEGVRTPSTTVPIRASGSKPPFFCVHGAWGTIVFGAELARHLGPDQPFYGLQAPGLQGEQEPFTTIEEMAAPHVREIKQIQPQGPYYIGGLSLGGLIAFEIAQQLHAQGQPVGLAVLIDAYPALRRGSLSLWRGHVRRVLIDNLVGRVVFHGRNLLEEARTRPAAAVRDKARRLGKRVAARLRIDHQANEAHLGDSYALKVRRANIEAMRKYEPRPYAGRIALLMTSESKNRRADGRSGWCALALGGLDVYLVPGDHATMLREPHIAVTAGQLRECLSRAQIQSDRVNGK